MPRRESGPSLPLPLSALERGGDTRRHLPTCLGQTPAGQLLLEQLLEREVPLPLPVEHPSEHEQEYGEPTSTLPDSAYEEIDPHRSHIDYLLSRATV